MTVTISGEKVVVEEVGDCEQPHNWDSDGQRLKDAFSDAYKRCAMRLGCGLHLWSQDEYFLHDELTKNSAGPGSQASKPAPGPQTASADGSGTGAAVSRPQNAGGGANGGSQTPAETQADASLAPPPTQSQPGGDTQQADRGEVAGAPPAANLWATIQDAVDKGLVNRTKVHMAAARLCTEHSKPIPAKYPDIAECDEGILAAIVTGFDLVAA
jgi:hypothetical protein